MNNNNLNLNISSNSIGGNILYIIVTMFVVALLIAGLVYLIKFAQQCMTYTGYYEPFANTKQSQYIKELKERIQKVKQLNEILDDSIDTFGDNVQDTCDVYAQVEEVYIGNNSVPSEEEYGLPKEELNKRLDRRKQSAKRRLQDARGMYGASIKTQVYECFANPNPVPDSSTPVESAQDLEDELRSELEDLESKIQSVDHGPVGQKGDSLNALLKFNNKYIKKSLQEMGNEKARLIEGYAGLLPPPENQPVQILSGTNLIARADKAILKANKIYAAITDQRTVVQNQKELVKEMTKATSRIESGNITPGDLVA